MRLVGAHLRAMEKNLGLDIDSIKENLRVYFSKAVEAESGIPPSPEEVEVLVQKVWRSWLRWRLSEKMSPQQKSQEHQAAALGFASIEECEEYSETLKSGRPLPLRPKAIQSAIREAVGVVSRPYIKPRRVRDFIRELYKERLEALPQDGRDYISERWLQIQVQADDLDNHVADLEKFLNLEVFRPPATDVMDPVSQVSDSGSEAKSLGPHAKKS